jgi:hypothetical protein
VGVRSTTLKGGVCQWILRERGVFKVRSEPLRPKVWYSVSTYLCSFVVLMCADVLRCQKAAYYVDEVLRTEYYAYVLSRTAQRLGNAKQRQRSLISRQVA